MKKISKINLLLLIFLLIIVFIISFVLNGCSLANLFDNFNFINSTSPDIMRINLDENELKSLEITNQTIEEKFDTSNEIKVSTEGERDPFMPFFLNSNTENENQKNMLTVKRIYSESSIFFVEINLNDAVYKLKIDDLFGKIYQVKAINADSVVLLKGDEIITLFVNEIYYD